MPPTANHFAALGTYLANLRDEETRVKYTQLLEQLNTIVKQASRTPPADLQKMLSRQIASSMR